jgi:sugar O-acyltransferase (sialic acid O-acetyltransferase NeuD family)
MKQIVVFGGSGQAHAAIDALEEAQDCEIAGILDDRLEPGSLVMRYPVLGRIDDLRRIMTERNIEGGHVAIGDNWTRGLIAAKVEQAVPGFHFVAAVHPGAVVSRHACVGRGALVLAGAIISSKCCVHEFCTVWTGASLDHDSTLEAFSSLAPGVVTGGNVRVGAYSAVCLSAGIVHGVSVGTQTVVGAGSLVLDDLPDYVVAYGNPARVIRKRREGDSYL